MAGKRLDSVDCNINEIDVEDAEKRIMMYADNQYPPVMPGDICLSRSHREKRIRYGNYSILCEIVLYYNKDSRIYTKADRWHAVAEDCSGVRCRPKEEKR